MNIKDQLGRVITLPNTPKRIISLVPSQTELLYDLGLSDNIVGQTLFCVHPHAAFKASVKIGGTKKLNIEKIVSLKPDVIIANKEENEKEQIEELERHFPVWISDVNTFEDAVDMIESVGLITGTEAKAANIITSVIEARNAFLKKAYPKQRVVYLIWNEPLIAVGKATFIDTMLSEAGYENAVTESRYPEISIETIQNLNPDLVFLSSEPFPFKEIHKEEINRPFNQNKAVLVDGEMFSWYGSRLIQAYDYFSKIRKPEMNYE